MILEVMKAILSPEKFSASTGFEPLTSRYWRDALTNLANEMVRGGHLCACIYIYIYIYSYQHCTDEAQKAETVLSTVRYGSLA